MTLCRFKISPELLTNSQLSQEEFSAVLSQISIGPAYKTTAFNRHNRTDDLLFNKVCEKENIGNDSEKLTIADLGASDGTASLYLMDKLRSHKNVLFGLYDKYPSLQMKRSGPFTLYANTDDELVYIKFLCFILYTYPVHIKIKMNGKSLQAIGFDNPRLSKYNLRIRYFDIFNSQSDIKFDFIKCANILHPAYFSKKTLLIGLANLYRNLSPRGLLFLIHDNHDKEMLLLLQQTSTGLSVLDESNDKSLIAFLDIRDRFIAIPSARNTA